jgi:hypothetical protein
MTTLEVSQGAYWQCAHCRSPWDARRLATVAAYAVWETGHTPLKTDWATISKRR